MPLTAAERRVCEAIETGRGELVGLAGALIGFDTTARQVGDPCRDEAALQEYLAARLSAAGASVDVWEPDAAALAGMPLVPPGLSFEGRPQLIARKVGRGGGRSLVFNGHIDVVSAEPRSEWTSDPFVPSVRDGLLYGRGACDMKGGIAAMVFAVETLSALGVSLDGDLLVATNTDEESSGAGGTALVEHGLRADAGVVTEPTGFQTWIACRGSDYGVITVPGRPGHAEVRQPDWRLGGAVNAIEKTAAVLEAIASLRQAWASRPGDVASVPVAAVAPSDAGARRRVGGDLPGIVRAHDRGDVPTRAGRPVRVGERGQARGRAVDRHRDVEGRLAARAPAGHRVVAEPRDAVRDLA